MRMTLKQWIIRDRKLFKTVGWIILVLGFCYVARIGLIFFAAAQDEKQGKIAWELYKAEAVRRGVKLEMRDYLRAPIPEADNFGACPLFVNAFADEQAAKVFELLDWDAEGVKKAKGAKEKLEAWREHFARKRWISTKDNSTAPVAVAKVLNERFGKPWAQLVDYAQRPDCIFPVAWENGVTVQLPHLQVLMFAGRHATIRTQIKLIEGDLVGALGEWKLLWRLQKAVDREPHPISGLVKLSLQALALSVLQDGLEMHAWGDAELQAMELALREPDLLAEFSWRVNAERAHLSDEFLHVQERRNGNIRVYFNPDSEPKYTDKLASIYYSVLRINLEADEALKTFDPEQHLYLNEGQPPYDPRNSNDAADKRRYLLYVISSPSFTMSSMRLKIACTASNLDQARIACALERFRLKESKYPATLADLVPRYLDKIPHDLMSGEALRYRLEGEGFILYSVGANGTDENGKTHKEDLEEKDWKWGVTGR